MFDYVNFQKFKGNTNTNDLKLFGLSTCGFCKKAVAFLKEKNASFSLVYIDKIETETKNKIKDEIKRKFDMDLKYPTLLIDEKDFLIGFIRYAWEKALERNGD